VIFTNNVYTGFNGFSLVGGFKYLRWNFVPTFCTNVAVRNGIITGWLKRLLLNSAVSDST